MRMLYLGIGVVALLIGIVWILQGAGVLLGSIMSGSTFWLGAGVGVVVVGAAALVLGARGSATQKPA